MAKLSYITMCIKESFRLYPPSLGAGKLLLEDMVINGQRFPKGILVLSLKQCVLLKVKS